MLCNLLALNVPGTARGSVTRIESSKVATKSAEFRRRCSSTQMHWAKTCGGAVGGGCGAQHHKQNSCMTTAHQARLPVKRTLIPLFRADRERNAQFWRP